MASPARRSHLHRARPGLCYALPFSFVRSVWNARPTTGTIRHFVQRDGHGVSGICPWRTLERGRPGRETMQLPQFVCVKPQSHNEHTQHSCLGRLVSFSDSVIISQRSPRRSTHPHRTITVHTHRRRMHKAHGHAQDMHVAARGTIMQLTARGRFTFRGTRAVCLCAIFS